MKISLPRRSAESSSELQARRLCSSSAVISFVAVDAFAKRRDAPRADVEADDIMLARERDGERKTDIAKTDDSNLHLASPLFCAGRKGEAQRLQIGWRSCASAGRPPPLHGENGGDLRYARRAW